MMKWTKTAGIVFMAAASVYADRAIAAKPVRPVISTGKSAATDVKLLDQNDPFDAVTPTTQPASAESTTPAAPLQINPDGTFSLNISGGADIVEQLRVIGFQAQTSIIPSKEVHGSLPAIDLYDVTVHEALDALLHANGYAWREKGKFIYVYSAKEVADMETAARVANTEVFHLYYTPAANAVTMIKPVLSADAQVSFTTPPVAGIATGTSDVGGNSNSTEDMIVITDYAENLDRVRAVLKDVDRRPQQILIEATILRAALSEDNKMGIDFNVVGGVDFNTITSSSGQITNANLPTGSFSGGNTLSTVGTGNSFSGPIAGGLKVGVVSQDFSVFLSALEGVTDTTVLANPKVLALNKQKGEVIVGREDGYITTTTTETQTTQTVEFLKTGTRLVFRPYIADDGYIRMEVHPEDSSGGLQAANLPFKITTEVTSNIMVKDGRTIVIGGLFREESNTGRSQIPVLGNLPLAGPLFRNHADSTRREEVIILLTPHIVKDDAAYAELSEKELRDAEKLRIGVRKGMMFWGRERLAEMNYEWAVAEMNKTHPNRGRALWNLDAATNLNPKFIEAINLKQELTGKQIAASDNSTIRSFVSRAILADRIPATQPAAELSPAGPTTLPVAAAPSTQPAVASTEAEQQLAGVPTTAPTPQPLAKGFGWSDLFATALRAAGPVHKQENAAQTTVTELPAE